MNSKELEELRRIDMVKLKKKNSAKKKVVLTESRKKILELNKMYKNGYKYKMILLKTVSIVGCAAVIGVISLSIIKVLKGGVDTDTNLSSLDSNKYARELANVYNQDGEKENFMDVMYNIKQKATSYILLNTTLEEGSFDKLVNEVNAILDSDDWSKLDSELKKPTYYNGKYIVLADGTVKFKFSTKEIEPSWAKELEDYVILN